MKLVLALLSVVSYGQPLVHLSQATNQAFVEYARQVEAAPGFHSTDKLRSPIAVKDGMIHDIRMGQQLPGVKLERVLAVFDDYDNYKRIFAPEVVDSRLLSHDGNLWRAALQLKRKKFLTAILNTEYEIERREDKGSWILYSRSTKSAEVENGVELPAGQGRGYLWRLNAYWLIEPQANGVYLECRSISLTRDIPTGLGWAIRPIVASLPKESLEATFAAIQKAVR